MKLFRPVGLKEYELIKLSNFKKFPPRLPNQPIFYPVLNIDYAIQIAKEWNTIDAKSDFVGIVTSFFINDEFIKNYKVKTVGGTIHQEYWIDAIKINEFNDNIIGNIKVENIYYGTKYLGTKIEGGKFLMKAKVKFYKCLLCGNQTELIYFGGGSLSCCGAKMSELVPNTTDAAQEKHVPTVTNENGKLIVKVGSVAHPMTAEHYIQWIAVVSDNSIERIDLTPESKPEAIFENKGDVDVYAYCNLHGLWKK